METSIRLAKSRKGYQYPAERVTPVGEIPVRFQLERVLPGGNTQIVDRRLCYIYDPTGKHYVESGSVAADAVGQGFSPRGRKPRR